MILDRILDAYNEEEFLKADGFDKAVIGVESSTMRLVYSVKKCLAILRTEQKMNREDAQEWFDTNVAGSYIGDKTPIFCDDDF